MMMIMRLIPHSEQQTWSVNTQCETFIMIVKVTSDSELGLLTYSVKHVHYDDHETDSSQQTWPADAGETHSFIMLMIMFVMMIMIMRLTP